MLDVAQILLSAAAGAVLAGGGQLVLGLIDRRRRGRVAAKIVFQDLYSAYDSYTAAIDEPQDWWELDLNLDGWNKYREDLAAGLEIESFHAIQSVFYAITVHEAWRKTRNPFPPNTISTTIPDIRNALNLIRLEGMTNRDANRIYRERPEAFWGYQGAEGPELDDNK